MGKSRYKVVTEGLAPYFLTCSVVNWMAIFGNPAIADIALDSLRFLHEQRRLILHGYVLMENHLHLVASSLDMRKEIGDFKSFTARSCIDWYIAQDREWILRQLQFHKAPHKCDQRYQLWQEGYHPQLIQGEAMLEQKLQYIHNNPIARGYVEDATHWRYSSARNYEGLTGMLPIEPLL